MSMQCLCNYIHSFECNYDNVLSSCEYNYAMQYSAMTVVRHAAIMPA